jgi:hypothetical protein
MKTATNIIHAALVALALACFANTASALTIYPINNGFEDPNLGSGCGAWQYNPASPGWTFINSSGIAANGSCFNLAGATNGNNVPQVTSDSGQAALLQGGDGTLGGVSFSQTLTLPAGDWVLYFSLEGRPCCDGANGVNVFLDGVLVGSTLFPANLGSFNGASVNLGGLATGSHTIAFAGTIPQGDHTTFVDNVRLAKGATGDLFASINGDTNNGGGSIYDYTPLQTTFASGLSRPRGVAFDSFGNLFVATNFFDGTNFQATILKITPDGTQSTFASLGNYFLEGIAIDRSDNVFVMALNQNPVGSVTIYEFTPSGVQSTFATPPSIQSLGLTFDSAGFLYVPVNFASGPPQIWKLAPDGTSTVFATASRSDIGFADLTFDRLGNLFVSGGPFVRGQDLILKYDPNGTESTFASGLYAPRGLVFDSGGKLFVAEIIPDGPGEILKFTPNGTGTLFASGIGRPQGNGGPEFLAIQPARPPFDVVASVPVPTNAALAVAVNEALNKIYTSGGASSGQDVVVIDGTTFTATDVGTGSGASVDVQTNHYWAANVYGGAALVRDGNTDNIIATIPLGFCPINTAYDSKKNRVWVGAQCGGGNDPVFAIDAANFNVLAGPIGSGGVMGGIIANGATGRLYLTASGISEKVDPNRFTVTTNAFGRVMAVNAVTNRLYAFDGTNLQIINGATNPETILRTVALSYTPAGIGANTARNRLYLANGAANSIEVRNGGTGALLATFSLAPFGATPNGAMAVDSTRGRIYVLASSLSGPVLLVIRDLK